MNRNDHFNNSSPEGHLSDFLVESSSTSISASSYSSSLEAEERARLSVMKHPNNFLSLDYEELIELEPEIGFQNPIKPKQPCGVNIAHLPDNRSTAPNSIEAEHVCKHCEDTFKKSEITKFGICKRCLADGLRQNDIRRIENDPCLDILNERSQCEGCKRNFYYVTDCMASVCYTNHYYCKDCLPGAIEIGCLDCECTLAKKNVQKFEKMLYRKCERCEAARKHDPEHPKTCLCQNSTWIQIQIGISQRICRCYGYIPWYVWEFLKKNNNIGRSESFYTGMLRNL